MSTLNHLAVSGKSMKYGTGSSVDDAIQQLKKMGADAKNVIVYKLPDGAHNGSYDGMNVRWEWMDGISEEQKLAGFEAGPTVAFQGE